MSDEYLRMPAVRERKLRIDNFFKGLDLAHDESVLSFDLASMGYNFDFASGALTDGWGLEPHELLHSQKIAHIWRFNIGPKQILMFADVNGFLHYVDESAEVKPLQNIKITGKIYAVNYRLYGEDVILICSDSADMLVWNGKDTPYYVANSPQVASMAVHNTRLLVVDWAKNDLRYSVDLDPTNWVDSLGQGGFVGLGADKGRLNKVLSFLNYAYVFRDYGISRISFASGAPVVTDLFTSGGKIYADTAAIAGDKIVFLCSDGLYVFDGLETKRILTNLKDAFLPSQSPCAAYYNGLYYLSVRLNLKKFDNDKIGCESGDYVNNGLLAFDAQSGDYCISRGVDAVSFTVYNDNLLCLTNGRTARVVKKSVNMGEPLVKKWRSVLTDLGSEKLKRLKSIHIDTNVPICLTVNADKVQSTFSADSSSLSVRPNMRAHKFSFALECNALGAKISRPVLTVNE